MSFTTERVNIYKEAIRQWGEDAQINMAVEELAELISALQHIRRVKAWGRLASVDEVVDEIADVGLILEQLKYIYNISDKRILEIQDQKLDKVKKLLNIQEANNGRE